ncbi:ubiquitin-like-conjugating enzyme ATG10 isoform X1 [Arapaima gigas]
MVMVYGKVGQMSSPGKSAVDTIYLDEESFQQCCELFLEHSCALNDGWSWEGLNGSGEGYMKKTVLGSGKVNVPVIDSSCKSEEDFCALGKEAQEVQQDTEGITLAAECSTVIRYEYHVLYSSSFQTPVLYFRASTLDGRPLSLDDMWANVHPNYRQRLLQGPWDTITQQEHPCLGQPFFVLHPCRTQEFMSPILKGAHSECRQFFLLVNQRTRSVQGTAAGIQPMFCRPVFLLQICSLGAQLTSCSSCQQRVQLRNAPLISNPLNLVGCIQ